MGASSCVDLVVVGKPTVSVVVVESVVVEVEVDVVVVADVVELVDVIVVDVVLST